MIARCTRALRKQVLHFLSSGSLVNVVEAQRELLRGGPEIKLIVGAARVLQLSRALSCCPVTLWVAVPASMLVRHLVIATAAAKVLVKGCRCRLLGAGCRV